ncbi:hypothetical protein Tco_0955143 [Tanacetum coccineum]|uniref:Uncharacterized protein n=1 Tax=Tanacetum coccineum TaxID=301880 RepID=A0ABQ5E6C6_9ASTR
MKSRCVNMELKYQNQALKYGQHGQILNETSNKAKIKKEIEVLETIYIELEYSVAKLLAENEKLHKENEHLKQTYKDLYDSIKKTRFASQVDVNNDLPKPVTPHYFLKVRESMLVKPHHVIAPGSSRNSSKESYRNWPASKSSEETLKAVQKAYHSRNPSLFSDSKHFVCSTCQKCVFDANHDACITKFPKEANSRVKVQSPKTRNSNKPVESKIHTQKPSKQIVTRHRFSLNKSSVVHEKTNTPRSCLKWIPTCRLFNTVGLSSLEPALHELTPAIISSGLMPNRPPSTPFVPPSRTDWDILFQPLFDEIIKPPSSVDRPTPEVIALIAEVVAS